MKHSTLSGKNVHVIHSFEFLTMTDMNTPKNYCANDLYKIGLLKQTNELYMLTSLTPTWKSLSSTGVLSASLGDIRPSNSYGTYLRKDIWNILPLDVLTDENSLALSSLDTIVLAQGKYQLDISTKIKTGIIRLYNETTKIAMIYGTNGVLSGIISSNGLDKISLQQYVSEDTLNVPHSKEADEVFVCANLIRI